MQTSIFLGLLMAEKPRFRFGWLAAALLVLAVMPLQASALSLSLKDVNGHSHTIADEHGHWLVVNIWATWCPPCRHELPELAAFARKHQNGNIRIWGLSVDQERSAAELSMFADQHGLGYPIFKVTPQQVGRFGPVPGIPTTFLINPQGKVVAKHVGGITAALLQQMISRQQQLASQ